MRRILYVTDSLMAGGIESQLVDLVTRLDRSQFEPKILCLYGPTKRALHFAPQLEAAGIQVFPLDLGESALDKAMAVRKIVQIAHAFQPHLIQAENYHSNLLTRIARPFLPPTRLIATVRGVLTRNQLRYERFTAPFYDHLVASAPFLKTLLEQKAHAPGQKIVVAPNAVDVARFATPRNPSLRSQIAPNAHRVFVSIGRISNQKTMHLIPLALGRLKQQNRLPADVRVFIVGPVQDDPMKALLDEAIVRADVGANVICQEATRTPEDYFHACDASILFSTLEGLPIVALESLAAGRPVVISAEANAAEVIHPEATGWVVRSGDVGSLAETLHTILTLPAGELERMQPLCRNRAEEFSMTALVQRYTAFYETWTAAPIGAHLV